MTKKGPRITETWFTFVASIAWWNLSSRSDVLAHLWILR